MSFEELGKAIAEIQQPRSNFQLDKFVIGQHPTPEMQYYQVVLEIQDLLYKYKLAEIAVEKTKIKIKRLKKTSDELKLLKAKKLELELEQTGLAMLGTQRELKQLMQIWESFETKFTRSEIESAQQDYWLAKLANNAKAMLMSGSGVNAAHIEAMEQAGILDDFIEKMEIERKELK